MAKPDDLPPKILALQSTYEHPTVQKAIRDIEAVAGYRLTRELRAPFLQFHTFITREPPPKYITSWRSDPARNRWYQRHTDGILGDVQNALACVWYHRDNLCAIEEAVRQAFFRSGAQESLGNITIALGNTIRWDAEYQAFVLAVRRCLDYVARAFAAYFQNDFHSFRRLPSFLENAKPILVASGLMEVHGRHEAKFDYVLSDGKKKSIRDLLSHYEYIGAGTLNLSSRGHLMAGGGERLMPSVGLRDEGLSAIISKRADDLYACLKDLIAAFVAAAEQEDAAPGA